METRYPVHFWPLINIFIEHSPNLPPLCATRSHRLETNGWGSKMAGDVGRDTGGPSGQGQGLWKLEVARQVLAEDYGPRLDWVAVAKAFDHDRFNIPDQV